MGGGNEEDEAQQFGVLLGIDGTLAVFEDS